MDSRNELINRAASAIFVTFGKAPDAKRTAVIADLVRDKVTAAEYKRIERQAFDLAAQEDKKNGFKPEPGAAGRDRYGPRQRAMQVRGAERRAVYGYLAKHPNEDVRKATFEQVLLTARQFLQQHSLKWNGEPRKPRSAAPRVDIAADATRQATADVMGRITQRPGESMADYMMRIAGDIETAKAEATEHLLHDRAEAIATKLVWDHGLDLCHAVATRLLSAEPFPEPAQRAASRVA